MFQRKYFVLTTVIPTTQRCTIISEDAIRLIDMLVIPLLKMFNPPIQESSELRWLQIPLNISFQPISTSSFHDKSNRISFGLRNNFISNRLKLLKEKKEDKII
jgi:hypothetical protein